MNILDNTKNTNIVQLSLNFLLKAVNYKDMWIDLKDSIKRTLRKIVCAMDSEVYKKIQKIDEKIRIEWKGIEYDHLWNSILFIFNMNINIYDVIC